MRFSHYFILIVFGFFGNRVMAQGRIYSPKPISTTGKNFDVGIFLGGSYYVGDLNPAGHLNRFTRPAAGAFYRINFNPRISAKAFAAYGVIEADDLYSMNAEHRNRNLSFKSNLYEFSVQGEFNFLPYSTGSKKLSKISPYVFLGVGLFHFEPKAYYQSSWHSLQPLGTEGQGLTTTTKKTYSLTQFSIPFGVGIKFNTSKRIGMGLEWGLRKTFTDYIDDVSGKFMDPFLIASENGSTAGFLSDRSLSVEGTNIGKQRGNPKTKDWYSFIGVTVAYRLKMNENKCEVPH
jgi:hypothetical protein